MKKKVPSRTDDFMLYVGLITVDENEDWEGELVTENEHDLSE